MKDADAIVFVVDDDSSIREAISSLLSLSGLRVETFATAQEFLRSKRPDLPGCVATGSTIEETREHIRQAIKAHLEGMREDGDPIPAPRTICDNVEVA